MVIEELDALRGTFANCKTLAFADLSTQMILVTDTNADLPREALDGLCAEAALMLGAGDKVALGETSSEAALVASKDALRLFVRAQDEPNDVLCCICTPELDVETFLIDARDRLNRMSRGN